MEMILQEHIYSNALPSILVLFVYCYCAGHHGLYKTSNVSSEQNSNHINYLAQLHLISCNTFGGARDTLCGREVGSTMLDALSHVHPYSVGDD